MNSLHEHHDYPNGGEGWVRPGSSPVAVVFVHGFSGDFHVTWTWSPSRWGKFWRNEEEKNLLGDLLTTETDLPCDYYSFSHPSGNFDVARVANLADALRTFLDTTVANGPGKRPVILVSHSLGGVLCRRAVLNQLDPSVRSNVHIIGLLMMGTPNLGTDVARIAVESRSAADIEPWSDYLEDLNRDWLRHIVNGGDPDKPPSERIRLKCTVLYGLTDHVVPPASSKSGVYLGELYSVYKGHIAMPKCQSKGDPAYGVLVKFIKDTMAEAEQDKVTESAVDLSYRARRHILDKDAEWTKQETEIVRLTPHPALSPEVLNCTITSTRIGWQPRDEITVCIQLPNTPPPADVHLDYRHILGRGALTQEEYANLGDSLRSASLTQQEFDKLLRVEVELIATDLGGRKVGLMPPRLVTGPGFACLHYGLEQPRSMGRDNRLTLTLQTTLRRHQAWYGFRSTRTVLGETTLQLIAPFRLYAVSTFWWSGAMWKDDELGANSFSSSITIPGPLPIGNDVIWLFEPQAGKEKS